MTDECSISTDEDPAHWWEVRLVLLGVLGLLYGTGTR